MSTPSTAGSYMTPAVAAVILKLPPFNFKVWFTQVKAQFTTRNISAQKTRFDYFISCLSLEYATEVHNLLLKLREENRYNVLKQKLIKRTAALEQHKLQQLINSEELNDRNPTQLLWQIRQLLTSKLGLSADTNTFLCELFLQRLPTSACMVLPPADTTTASKSLPKWPTRC